MFAMLHAMFVAQYTELWNAVDPIAERIRSLGYLALGSCGQFGQLRSQKNAPETPPKAMEMVRILVQGHGAVALHGAQRRPAGRQGWRRAHRRPADAAADCA